MMPRTQKFASGRYQALLRWKLASFTVILLSVTNIEETPISLGFPGFDQNHIGSRAFLSCPRFNTCIILSERFNVL